MLAVMAVSMTASAQYDGGFYGNKFFDNCYVGLNGGAGAGTTHQKIFHNLNWNVGVRVGKYISPIFGVAIEGNAYFRNHHGGLQNGVHGRNLSTGTAIRYSRVGLIGTINLMNAISAYPGEPRKFEIFVVPGFDWGHNFGDGCPGTKLNTLNNKLALDFAYNFGKYQEWQVYVEPSINYCIAGIDDSGVDEYGVGKKIVDYDINNSFLQCNVGLIYKFKTSNGAHNFMIAETCDPMELDELNNTVNELRAKDADNQTRIENLQKEVRDLQDALNECNAKPAVEQIVEPSLPAVFYQCNKSVITPAQAQNVQIAADVLKNHPTYRIQIKGYASPEGPSDNNTSLGIRRADAVKDMLIKKYGIAADRIDAEGCGETDKLFEVYEFNRVAMMYLQKK